MMGKEAAAPTINNSRYPNVSETRWTSATSESLPEWKYFDATKGDSVERIVD